MQTRLNTASATLALTCLLAIAARLSADEWGTLSGRFIYDDTTIPTPVKIVATKDREVCGKHELYDESLEVSKDGGLQYAVVYLRSENVQVAPSYAESANADVVIEMKNCRFEPHVAVMRTTQTLIVKNCDQIAHNARIDPLGNPEISPIIQPGDTKRQFQKEENLPAKIGCSIHPWMDAWILIRKSPYATVSVEDGNFEIKDLPIGQELEFQLWHERPGYLKEVSINNVKVDAKGRFKFKLAVGENKLGDIKVSPKLFAARN